MHSTGPWTAMVTDTMGDTPALWDIVQRSSGGTVAEIQSHNPDDAALVAAAPDLLRERACGMFPQTLAVQVRRRYVSGIGSPSLAPRGASDAPDVQKS
jgi:hypothetical protein